MTLEAIKSIIEERMPHAIAGEDPNTTPLTLTIALDKLKGVCELLHSHEATYFDSLSCITGLDNGPEVNTLEVIYHLYSIPHNLHLALKVVLDRSNPETDSVVDIWHAANWHEREVHDMVGVQFKDHPDLRRILLPDDWEGYPLRKDYEEQEKYHDVKVKY